MEHTTKLFFLGTAAADFSPRLKTDCADRFDKDARRASCMLIGENYMVDCGLYAMESLRIAGTDISKITDIFVTHLITNQITNFFGKKHTQKNQEQFLIE